MSKYLATKGAWLSERLRRWSDKPDVLGSIPVTTEFFLIYLYLAPRGHTTKNIKRAMSKYLATKGAWLSERLRHWSDKPDVLGSIPVTTEFFLISCDSNQVP